jgi:hypothetical protein
VRSIALKVTIIAALMIPALENTGVAGTNDSSAPSPSSGPFLQSECQAIWSMAAGDEERLSYDKAVMYVTDLQGADPDHDGYFTQTEFIGACQKGLVTAAKETKSSHSIMLRKH